MSLTLWLPDSAVEGNPQGDGRFRCNLCDARFHDPSKWEKHLGPCKNAHLDEIRANAPSVKNRGGPFDPETWDPEEEAHLLKVGRRMRQEGRWEVRPNERPGAAGGGVL